MWLRSFMPVLASEVAQRMVLGRCVEQVSVRGYNLRVWTTENQGQVQIDYRYPQKYFLVQATLYYNRRVVASGVHRFTLPTATLMALRMGGSGEKALRRLAVKVAEWLEETGAR
jgi:hypothetical protein